jgi:protocatechuate 3,4-dioxygenase beta subunit
MKASADGRRRIMPSPRILGVAALLLSVSAGPTLSGKPLGQGVPSAGQGQTRPGLPARDTQAAERTGTGVVAGRVVSAETGAPLRRAQVRLSGAELRSGRVAMTDADGRYEFRELPPGRYTLTASKAGYVAIQYGQRRAFEPGRPLELRDAQVIDRADFALPRGSAITGRVLDEFGEPVAEAVVQALHYQYVGGRRQLVPTGRMGQTNDLGQFRIYGLPPGEYYVSASAREGLVMGLDPAAVLSSGTRVESSSYAPTYYPGTPNVAEAQRLAIGVGQEASGIDFALLPVRTARLSGIAIDSEGRPLAGAAVMLIPRDTESLGVRGLIGGAARVGPDGTFVLSNVVPGEYVLQVRSGSAVTVTMTAAGSGGFVMATAGPPPPPAPGAAGSAEGANREPEFAILPITVTGQDIAGLTLVTHKGGRLSGRVVFEDGPAPDRSRWADLRVAAAPADLELPLGAGAPSVVREDGTFELRGLAGRVLVRPSGLPTGWTLKAVDYGGQDITDTPIEFKGTEEATGVRVVLSALTTEVVGSVSDDRGQPVKEYTTVIFAQDADRWGPFSRFIAVGRPDQNGRYQVRGLPPGAYFAAALDYVQQGEWLDPAFLERLRPRATALRLAPGETRALDLRLLAY